MCLSPCTAAQKSPTTPRRTYSYQSTPIRSPRAAASAETYTLGLHRTEENLEVAKKENSVILIEDDYKQQYAGFNPGSSESYIIFEFMQDKNMSQSVDFAKMIQRQFKQGKRIDKGVHQAGFLVLRATSMPSVLVELGYITNPNEESYLLSENGSTNLAQCIYRAFRNYKDGHRPDNTDIKNAETPVQNDIEETVAAIEPETTKTANNSTVSEKPVFNSHQEKRFPPRTGPSRDCRL